MIHSNSNLGLHGQGYLSLSGPGDVIEAQRLILSLFYRVQVSIMVSFPRNVSNMLFFHSLQCTFKVCITNLFLIS